ncbi:MAG: BamA/TamA family outer membrane protein [Longimonas sp.]|uniref:BamA/TamA family outer membrane protein n=1 Tax=Longimonas sp. TaxID=2039626 RepID=UPI00335EC71F
MSRCHVSFLLLLIAAWGVPWQVADAHAAPSHTLWAASIAIDTTNAAPRTRTEQLRRARAQQPRVDLPEAGRIERFIIGLEDDGLIHAINRITRGTLRAQIGGLRTGTGLGARLSVHPLHRASNVDLMAGGALSIRGFWTAHTAFALQRGPVFTQVYGHLHLRPEEVVLSAAPDAEERLAFRIRNTAAGGLMGLRLSPALTLAADVAYTTNRPRTDDDLAASELLLDLDRSRYVTYGTHLLFDRRDARYGNAYGNRFTPLTEDLNDRPVAPRSGTMLQLKAHRFYDTTDRSLSFGRLVGEVQQYLSTRHGYHVLALRHRTVLTDVSSTADIPFFELPALGGSYTLRGFRDFQFRGRHALLFNAEYRWRTWHFADLVLFADAGKSFDTVDRWGLTDLNMSYGIGSRLSSNGSTLGRIDLAYGDDGLRLTISTGNVF